MIVQLAMPTSVVFSEKDQTIGLKNGFMILLYMTKKDKNI